MSEQKCVGTEKCAICGTYSNVTQFHTPVPCEGGSTTVTVLVCQGARKTSINPTSCAGLLTRGEIYTREREPGTLRFALSEKATKAVNSRGGGRQDGLGYFIHAPRLNTTQGSN